jgi:hypothetical protein
MVQAPAQASPESRDPTRVTPQHNPESRDPTRVTPQHKGRLHAGQRPASNPGPNPDPNPDPTLPLPPALPLTLPLPLPPTLPRTPTPTMPWPLCLRRSHAPWHHTGGRIGPCRRGCHGDSHRAGRGVRHACLLLSSLLDARYRRTLRHRARLGLLELSCCPCGPAPQG